MCPKPRPNLLVLDCDGVLVRSEKANVAYYNHLFEALELPRVEESQREAVSLLNTLSTTQVIERFVPSARIDEAFACAKSLKYQRFLDELQPEPGWIEVLERWRTSGKAAVATNRGASARAVLDAVGLLASLDLVVTIRDVARPKPHPDLLLKAVNHFELEPHEAIYVGDADLDREAAVRAGIPFLGFRRCEAPSAASAWDVERFLRSLARQPSADNLHPETC